MADARVLSYHDVLLRQADIDLLSQPEWLNDQLIAFYFTYLLEDMHKGLGSQVCLMPPGTSFLLLNSEPTEAAMIFGALKLHEKELVIYGVNDNPDVEYAAGGSHWSCLAFHRPSNTFRHFDSSGAGGNTHVAKELAGAAAPLVRSKASRAGPAGTAVQQPSFVQVSAMPKQDNGYDCGVYVCAAARALCSLAAEQLQCQQHAQEPGGQQDGQAGAASTAGGDSCSCSNSAMAATDYEQREQDALSSITSTSIAQLRRDILTLIKTLAAAAK